MHDRSTRPRFNRTGRSIGAVMRSPIQHCAHPGEKNGIQAHVGNLAYSTTDADLQTLFAQAGAVKICGDDDKMSGRSKGFAFVEMENGTGHAKCHQHVQRQRLSGSPAYGQHRPTTRRTRRLWRRRWFQQPWRWKRPQAKTQDNKFAWTKIDMYKIYIHSICYWINKFNSILLYFLPVFNIFWL